MGDKQSGELSRREVLGMVVGVGGLSLCGDATALLSNTAPGPVFTPSVILGPFYPQIKPSAQDPDLTLLPGKQKRAAGTIIYLTGQVRNLKGEPVRGARVTIGKQTRTGGTRTRATRTRHHSILTFKASAPKSLTRKAVTLSRPSSPGHIPLRSWGCDRRTFTSRWRRSTTD